MRYAYKYIRYDLSANFHPATNIVQTEIHSDKHAIQACERRPSDLNGNGIGTVCDGLEAAIDDNGTINGDELPSIGMVGTVVAISSGFFLAIRREDEE